MGRPCPAERGARKRRGRARRVAERPEAAGLRAARDATAVSFAERARARGRRGSSSATAVRSCRCRRVVAPQGARVPRAGEGTGRGAGESVCVPGEMGAAGRCGRVPARGARAPAGARAVGARARGGRRRARGRGGAAAAAAAGRRGRSPSSSTTMSSEAAGDPRRRRDARSITSRAKNQLLRGSVGDDRKAEAYMAYDILLMASLSRRQSMHQQPGQVRGRGARAPPLIARRRRWASCACPSSTRRPRDAPTAAAVFGGLSVWCCWPFGVPAQYEGPRTCGRSRSGWDWRDRSTC